MHASPALRLRLQLTALAGAVTGAVLGLQHLSGGIAAHHFLHDPARPAISNAWALLLVPALTWAAVAGVQRREVPGRRVAVNAAAGFAGALLFGVLLSLSFGVGTGAVTDLLALGALAAGLFVPLHRAEIVLGFVLGMTWTFGAVLPTAFAAVVASASLVVRGVVRPAVMWAARRVLRRRAAAG